MITVQLQARQVECSAVTDARRQHPDNVVSFIVVARHGGMSYERIASLMNRIGLPTLRGGNWHGSTVARVARRHSPLYVLPPRRRTSSTG